jgi:hypothetical protein
LWEAWVAGCCVIHVDFEKYGCVLPVLPQNGEHYIGLDINHIENFESLLPPPPDHKVLNSNLLAEIALNGKEFALNHYTPKKVAERLMNIVDLS